MQITAAVTRHAQAPFTIETLTLDAPRDHELRVRIVAAGICHTDLVAAAGAFGIGMPAVFGHEGAGIVEAVGAAVTRFAPGDRVALSFQSCGHCANCASHQPAYCHGFAALNYSGVRADGTTTLRDVSGAVSGSFFGQSSFATHALASERNAVKLPDDMPLHLACALGCGVQTGAGAIMRSLACKPGSSLLILGAGAVGLSAVLGATVMACTTIVVVEPQASRRALALELGATQVIDPNAVDLAAALREVAPAGFHYAFDTTAIPAVTEAAANALAPHGSFGFVGVPRPDALDARLPLPMMTVMARGLTYKGIIEGDSSPDEFIPQLIALYRAGRFAFDKLIRVYPFAAINEAISDQHRGVCVKAVLQTDTGTP